jgi:hypothetical protein
MTAPLHGEQSATADSSPAGSFVCWDSRGIAYLFRALFPPAVHSFRRAGFFRLSNTEITMSNWLKWWYPGPRWSPETLESVANLRRARRERERALEREIMNSRLVLAQIERLADALESVERRLAAIEEWRKQEEACPTD